MNGENVDKKVKARKSQRIIYTQIHEWDNKDISEKRVKVTIFHLVETCFEQINSGTYLKNMKPVKKALGSFYDVYEIEIGLLVSRCLITLCLHGLVGLCVECLFSLAKNEGVFSWYGLSWLCSNVRHNGYSMKKKISKTRYSSKYCFKGWCIYCFVENIFFTKFLRLLWTNSGHKIQRLLLLNRMIPKSTYFSYLQMFVSD